MIAVVAPLILKCLSHGDERAQSAIVGLMAPKRGCFKDASRQGPQCDLTHGTAFFLERVWRRWPVLVSVFQQRDLIFRRPPEAPHGQGTGPGEESELCTVRRAPGDGAKIV